MLDLRNPQTQHIFRASAIEDQIRAHLVAIKRAADGADSASRYDDIIQRIIPKLRQLNNEHFGASAGIVKHLDAIAIAAGKRDLELCWKLFFALAEAPGDNFGTWAI